MGLFDRGEDAALCCSFRKTQPEQVHKSMRWERGQKKAKRQSRSASSLRRDPSLPSVLLPSSVGELSPQANYESRRCNNL